MWEITALRRADTLTLTGWTTESALLTRLLEEAREALGPAPVADAVTLLPASAEHALVRAAVAPVYGAPHLPAAQITQFVLGMRVDVVERRGVWRRVRAEDGYLGWVHAGFLAAVPRAEARAWEEGRGGEPVVSLGAELVDEDGQPFLRLPWGARLHRVGGGLRVPGGVTGQLGGGEVVDADRLVDRFPARGESAARTARRWLGAPYLWGGVTRGGVDCSGLVQAVCWMHGVALPRDADLQSRVGAPVEPGADFADLRPGDLLFFSETGDRVSHVTLCLEGPRVVHASLTNGGVGIDDLTSDSPAATLLRPRFVNARRLFPD